MTHEEINRIIASAREARSRRVAQSLRSAAQGAFEVAVTMSALALVACVFWVYAA